MSQEQEEAWSDVFDETDLEAEQSIPEAHKQLMLCDIQRTVGRLVSKSEQLLHFCAGKKKG